MKTSTFRLFMLCALLAIGGSPSLQAQEEVLTTLRGGEEIEGVLTGVDADSISLIVMREVNEPFFHKAAHPVRYAVEDVQFIQPRRSPNFPASVFLGLLIGVATYHLTGGYFTDRDPIEAIPLHIASSAAATALVFITQSTVETSERYHPVLAEDLAALRRLGARNRDAGDDTEPHSVWKRALENESFLTFELADGTGFEGVLYDVRPAALTVISDEESFRAHFQGRTCCAVPLTAVRRICPVFDEDAWEWRPGSGDPAFLAQFAVAEIKTR